MEGNLPSYIGGYQIQKKLGEGSFGRVYLAYDARVNRRVAIKVLLLTDKEVVTRFKNEAIVAGNLRHNNIVTIYEFGEHEGLPFLAMEFLDGENLQEVMNSKRELTMLQKLSIMTQMAEGLDCAHRHGVVHRDVKPANIMLQPDGTVKIMDFGIARLTGSQDATRLTQQGNVLGTLLYMAPEQFSPNAEVDALCDIFACGEVYYELLAGHHPFEASEPRVLLYKVTCEDPPPLQNAAPECPAALEPVVSRMLAKQRDLRYHSLREVLFDTQPVLIDLQQERAATLMGEAQALFQRKEAEAANALLPEILDLDPGNRTAYKLRELIQRELLKPKIESFLKTGREELMKRRFYEAIQAFEAAARLDSTNTEIHDLLGQAKTAQEQSQRASQLLAEARQAFDQQNLAAAYKSASEAQLFDPENQQAARLLLVIQSAIDRKRRQQRLEEALLKAEHLLMIQAYDSALDALAGLEAGDKRVEEMAERIRAQKLDHERSERLQAGMAAATEMLREQKLDEAVNYLGQLDGEFPDKPEVRQLLEYARKERQAQQRAEAIEQVRSDAQKLADAHDFRGALEVLDQGLQKYDEGSLVRLLGAVMAAKAAWEREEALRAARARCEGLRAEGKLSDAIQAAESALRIYKNDPALMELLRELESEWEQQKRAEEIRAAVAQARKFLEMGQPEKVLRILPETARRFPDSAEIQAALAEAQAAFQAQERLREVEALQREARAHADRSSHDAALQLLERGLEKFPGETGLAALREEVVRKKAAQVRLQDIQRTVQQSNLLAAEGRFSEALDVVSDALRRYEGENVLVQAQRRLEIDWARRQREEAIIEAGSQARALMEQGKSAAAVELLRAACESYPGTELASLLGRAERSAALEQFAREVRALMEKGEFEPAMKRIEQGMRTWPQERSLAGLQAEAAAGLAAIRRAQAIRDAAERCRLLSSQGRMADALRLADASLREYPGEAELLEARQEAQNRLDEMERVRRRAADLESLRRLEKDASTADAAQIRELADKVKALAKAYERDPEIEAAANRTLELLREMEDAGVLLANRDFRGLLAECERLRARYPGSAFFERLEAEAARGIRQQALQDIRQKLQAEQDLQGKAKLLDEALRLYPEEAWLQQESRVVRGKLGLVNSIAGKARAAEKAGQWDEAIAQWNSLGQLFGNYPGLDAELESLRQRKEQARAEARARSLEQIGRQMASGDYGPALVAIERAGREFPGDTELAALAERIAFVQRAVEAARASTAKQAFAPARKMLETALDRYPGDPLLQRELEAVAQRVAEREAAIGETVRQGEELAGKKQLDEAWKLAESALKQYGEEQRLVELRQRLQALRQQAENIRQAVGLARTLSAEQKFAEAAQAIEAELVRYPGDQDLLSELQAVAQRAAEREAAIGETVRQGDELAAKKQLDEARKLAESALKQYGEEPRLVELRRRLEALRQQAENIRQAVGLARTLSAKQKFAEAAQAIEAELVRYPGDQDLLTELQAVAQRVAEREAAIVETARQGEELAAQNRLDEAWKLAESALQQYGEEPRLVELRQRLQALRQQAEDIRQAVNLARTLSAEQKFAQAAQAIEAELGRYPDEQDLVRELQAVAQQAAAREAAIVETARQGEELAGQKRLDEAWKLAESALKQYGEEPRLLELRGRLQSRRKQAYDIRQAVALARDLSAKHKFAEAAQALETELGRYPGDQDLVRELQAVAQHAAEREASIAETVRQGEELAAQKRLDEAWELAESALQQHGEEPRLLELRRRLQSLRKQANDIRQAVGLARTLAAEQKYPQAAKAIETELARYPGDQVLVRELEAVAQRAAEREAAIGEALRQGEELAGQKRLDEASKLAESALKQYGQEQRLLELRRRLQSLRKQADEIRQAVSLARTLSAEQKFPQAAKAIETELRLYPDDQELLRELQAIREGAELLEARRIQTIRETVQQIEDLLSKDRLEDAQKLAAASLQQFPNDPSLAAAGSQVQARIREMERQRARAADLEALGRLEAEARALTAANQIAGLEQKVRTMASRYANDAGVTEASDAIQQQLDALRQAAALLARREYAAVLEICNRYPDHRLMQALKAEAVRGERALRVAALERQVDQEPDLSRQANLLDAALRSFPDEASLLERSRVVQGKLAQAEATAEKARQAGKAERWDEAIAHWNSVRKQHKEYPGLDQELARVEESKQQARAAERKRLGEQIRQQLNAGDYDKAGALLKQAQQQFPGDAELRDLGARMQAVRQVVQQGRTLMAERKLPQAADALEAGLRQYPGDKLLERELQAVRQETARQAELRAETIRQAAGQIETLTGQGQLADALKLAEASLRQYPGEASLLAAQEQAQAALAEARRQEQRNNDLAALRHLDAEARALTDVTRIGPLRDKVRRLAAPYAADEEISRTAADLEQQLAAMEQAQALLDQKDFAAVLTACAGRPGHPFFARLQAAAERGRRTAHVAEVERKVEAEPDLMRQIELLDATIRFYPDEPALVQRSRVVRSKLDQVDAIVQKARQAEEADDWDEALAQWTEVGRLYKDYPGLAEQIERITALKERARAARREQLGDQVWQRVNTGDYETASTLLDQAQQEFPGDAEMQFLREQVDSVLLSVREARDLAGKGKFSDAIRTLEAALERNAGDPLLESELLKIRQQAERHAALEQALAASAALGAKQKFADALEALEKFSSRYGTEAAIDQAAAAIRQAQEEARRQAEVHAAAAHARDLAREGKHEAIVQFVGESAPHVQQHREIRELLAAAEQILAERKLRQAIAELVAQARSLSAQSKFTEALQTLDRGARQYPGVAGEMAAARAEVTAEQAAWQQARDAEQAERELQSACRRAADMLAQNPAGAVGILTDLCARHPQRSDLAEQLAAARAALRSLELAQLTREVDKLCGKKKFAAALRKIDVSGMVGSEVSELHGRVEALVAVQEPPRPVPKIAWVAGAAAVLALAGWGISTLVHRDGTLIVETSPAAMVTVDQSAGIPADDKGLVSVRIPAGRHTLVVSQPGFEDARETVELKSGATNRRRIALNAVDHNLPQPAPVIASLDPGSVVKLGSDFTLTVSGSGFQSGTVVKWNGVALRTTYASARQLLAVVPANLVTTPGKAAITVVNPGQVISESVTLPINPSAPAIGRLQPDSVNSGDAGFVLHVTGSGFQPGATVQWSGVRLPATVESATSLRAEIPAKLIGKPGMVPVTVHNPSDVSSSAVTFTVHSLTPAPVLSGLNPASVTAGGAAFTLTVSGSSFVKGAAVQWNRSVLSLVAASPTQLKVAVPANLIANAGNARIRVVNPENVSSPELTLSINGPQLPPAISGLNPNAATAGTAVNLTVNGSGFQGGAKVEWNRQQVQTSFTSPTQLQAAIPAGLLPGPGSASVVVVNPGNVPSAPLTFTINPPAVVPPPVISGLTPGSTVAGGPAFTLTVNGSGFKRGAELRWNRSSLSLYSGTATQLQALVPASRIESAGTISVSVVNPDGLSGAAPFTITAPAVPAPAISGLSPGSTPAGGPAFTLTVNGSGFQPSATVQWNRSALTTTFGGQGQLTASVPANLIAAQGAAAITVLNPGKVSSGAITLTILPPQVSGTDPEVERVKSVLAEYAAAYSHKDIETVKALFQGMPKGTRYDLESAFAKSDYTVQYTIEVSAPPVIKGDEATVSARTVIRTTFAKKVSSPVTRDVVISLHRRAGQWTISAFR